MQPVLGSDGQQTDFSKDPKEPIQLSKESGRMGPREVKALTKNSLAPLHLSLRKEKDPDETKHLQTRVHYKSSQTASLREQIFYFNRETPPLENARGRSRSSPRAHGSVILAPVSSKASPSLTLPAPLNKEKNPASDTLPKEKLKTSGRSQSILHLPTFLNLTTVPSDSDKVPEPLLTYRLSRQGIFPLFYESTSATPRIPNQTAHLSSGNTFYLGFIKRHLTYPLTSSVKQNAGHLNNLANNLIKCNSNDLKQCYHTIYTALQSNFEVFNQDEQLALFRLSKDVIDKIPLYRVAFIYPLIRLICKWANGRTLLASAAKELERMLEVKLTLFRSDVPYSKDFKELLRLIIRDIKAPEEPTDLDNQQHEAVLQFINDLIRKIELPQLLEFKASLQEMGTLAQASSSEKLQLRGRKILQTVEDNVKKFFAAELIQVVIEQPELIPAVASIAHVWFTTTSCLIETIHSIFFDIKHFATQSLLLDLLLHITKMNLASLDGKQKKLIEDIASTVLKTDLDKIKHLLGPAHFGETPADAFKMADELNRILSTPPLPPYVLSARKILSFQLVCDQVMQKSSQLDHTIMRLAEDLKRLGGGYFKGLNGRELVGLMWEKKPGQSPSVRQAINYTNALSFFVIHRILLGSKDIAKPWNRQMQMKESDMHHKELAYCARWFRFFANLAAQSIKIGDFGTAMAIHAAFNSAPLLRLQHTHKRAIKEKACHNSLKELETLWDTQHNYKYYRDQIEQRILQQHANRQVDTSYVPFLGLYLQDLTFIDINPSAMRFSPPEIDGLGEERDNNSPRIQLCYYQLNINKLSLLADIHTQIQNAQDLIQIDWRTNYDIIDWITAYTFDPNDLSKSGKMELSEYFYQLSCSLEKSTRKEVPKKPEMDKN